MQSLRIAIRGLRRSPAFAVTAILTLALGISLSTAVFTVAHTFLIRRLPVTDENRIVVLQGESRTGTFSNFPLRLDEVREFARRSGALGAVAFFGFGGAYPTPVRDGDQLYRLNRALVSGNFFDVLGSRPALGRTLQPDDDVVGAAPVIVLSHRAWRLRFAGDSTVVGRTLTVHATGRPYRIVGVMPRGLDYPLGTEFWSPVLATVTGTADSLYIVSNALDIAGRLRAGAEPQDASSELTAWFERADAPALEHDHRGVARRLPALVLGDTKPAMIALSAAAALLLLLSCINVASLLLVRGLGRVPEIAVRTALGASRRQIVGQLLIESTVLAIAGGVIGAGLAAAAVQGFMRFAPTSVPRVDEIRVNGSMLLVATGISMVATLVSALAPALVASRAQLHAVLRTGARQSTSGRRFSVVREALVAGQVALAVVVLSLAGLLSKSLMKLERVDLAFAPGPIVVAELAISAEWPGDTPTQVALLNRLIARVAELPQVVAVTPVLTVPFDAAGGIYGRLGVPGETPDQVARSPMLDLQVVAPDYFRTLGVAIRQGHGFSSVDIAGAPPVVIVSESAARYYWPSGDAIGKQLTMGPGAGQQFTVIGVARDTRYRDLRATRPTVYFPIAQSFFPVVPLTLLIRATHSQVGLVPALRRAIATEPGVGLASAVPFGALLAEPLALPRLNVVLLSSFGGAAVLLAGIGMFGVIAATVRQRTREFGIRMALGATSTDMRRLVTFRSMAIAVVGIGLGLCGALVSGRLVGALLFEVRPTDALTLGLTSAVILGVAALASIAPAQASARIDPAIALRADV